MTTRISDITLLIGVILAHTDSEVIRRVAFIPIAENAIYLQANDGKEFVVHVMNYVKEEDGEPIARD